MKRTFIVVMMVLLAAMVFVSCDNRTKGPALHKVTFNADNGSDSEVKEVKDGEKVAKPEDPVRKGYTFQGWYDGEEVFDFETAVKKDYTLTARWNQLPTHMVTFVTTGGTGGPEALEVVDGEKAEKPETVPTHDYPEYYVFDCWTKEDETVFDFDNEVITDDITLYAKWKNRYAVGDKGPAGGTIIYVNANDSQSWKYIELAPESAGKADFGDIGIGQGHYTYTGVDMEADNIELLKQWVPSSDIWAMVKNYSTTVDGKEYTDWTLPTKDQLSQAVDFLNNNLADSFWTSSTFTPYGSTSATLDGFFWVFDKAEKMLYRSTSGIFYDVYCTRRF